MPSFTASLAGFVLRTTGYYRRMFTGGPQFQKNIIKVRAAPLPKPTAKSDLDVRQSEFQGRPVWHIAPKDRTPSAHILFWHGGGYVYPATDIHWKFLSHMASQYRWSITAPLYPLAPESSAEAITEWASAYYAMYQADIKGAPFIMGGDSAGGGLTAALAQMARDGGQPLPAGLLLICPWLNLDPAHPDQQKTEPRDGILTISGIAEGGTLYAGDLPRTDPRCSPIFGNWDGLPPILAFAGGDDILVTDSRALKAKVPSVDLTELAGMMHDWPIFSFSESRKAQAAMAGFVAQAVT
ncbi:MAG: alpha/beta hydrolase fold domain-containing protein [Sphingorhabdus sp.]